jgi:hypothetical protein
VRAEDTIRDGGGQRLERLSVAQAARALGVTESGVRKRVSRGTLPHERDDNGTVWVFVDPLQTVSGTPLDSQADEVRDSVLDALHDQVATLKDQVRYLQAHDYGPAHPGARSRTRATRIPSDTLRAAGQRYGLSRKRRSGEALLVAPGFSGGIIVTWVRGGTRARAAFL